MKQVKKNKLPIWKEGVEQTVIAVSYSKAATYAYGDNNSEFTEKSACGIPKGLSIV